MRLAELQKHIREHDHQPELAHTYFNKLIEEIGELSEAIRKNKLKPTDEGGFKGTAAEELYDVLYYICALANIYGIDLEHSFSIKTRLNNEKYGRNTKLDSASDPHTRPDGL